MIIKHMVLNPWTLLVFSSLFNRDWVTFFRRSWGSWLVITDVVLGCLLSLGHVYQPFKSHWCLCSSLLVGFFTPSGLCTCLSPAWSTSPLRLSSSFESYHRVWAPLLTSTGAHHSLCLESFLKNCPTFPLDWELLEDVEYSLLNE